MRLILASGLYATHSDIIMLLILCNTAKKEGVREMTTIKDLTTNQLLNGYWSLGNGMCFRIFDQYQVISELMRRGLQNEKLHYSEMTVAEEYRKQADFHKLHTINSDVLTKLITKNQHTISKKVSLWDSDISINDNILRVRAYIKGVMKYFEVWLSEYTGDFLIIEIKNN